MFSQYLCQACFGNAKKLLKKEIKEPLTETSLRWKCFGMYNKDRQVYNFKNKYVLDFTRKSIQSGKVCAFKR